MPTSGATLGGQTSGSLLFAARGILDVEVADVERVVFDVLTAWLDDVAH